MRCEDFLPIGELARRTGVNPVTLRAWERRYGLLVPERTAKGHRLYTQAHVERVGLVLRWLERGASVGQVRDLIERQADALTELQGDWQRSGEHLIEAIANFNQRAVDQQLNQLMALYPASTLCEQLLLPLLDNLQQRWRPPFDARLEQAFFHTWLRSKLGARVYHDNHSLEGAPVLLVSESALPFDAHLWLGAWLLSSGGIAVEVLEHPVGGKHLLHAIDRLQPRALVLYPGSRLDAQVVQALASVKLATCIGGASVSIHEERLHAADLPHVQLFDTPQALVRLLQRTR